MLVVKSLHVNDVIVEYLLVGEWCVLRNLIGSFVSEYPAFNIITLMIIENPA